MSLTGETDLEVNLSLDKGLVVELVGFNLALSTASCWFLDFFKDWYALLGRGFSCFLWVIIGGNATFGFSIWEALSISSLKDILLGFPFGPDPAVPPVDVFWVGLAARPPCIEGLNLNLDLDTSGSDKSKSFLLFRFSTVVVAVGVVDFDRCLELPADVTEPLGDDGALVLVDVCLFPWFFCASLSLSTRLASFNR